MFMILLLNLFARVRQYYSLITQFFRVYRCILLTHIYYLQPVLTVERALLMRARVQGSCALGAHHARHGGARCTMGR
mgnify:CR=1 FL=1